ncbi:MAG TPA: 2-hydroxyacyl-CoA dehydratase [Dehalococcoidia bacterium]|nr:2-hydroxyacyl-CoA dehydratase [Dehalococcoidia bacterium]
MTSFQNSKIDTIVRVCRLIMRMNRTRPNARPSEAMYYQMLTNYFTRLLNARENGDFVAAHTVFFPAELIYAMDMVPMHTETTTWMTALFTGECSDILEAGAQLGLATEICTPHRGLAGAFALGSLPHPDVILWSSMVCDNTAKSGELIMELCHCPGFFIDRPFNDSEYEIQYLVGELGDMVRFLEEKSGRKMNWDKLAEIVARMDRQIELIRNINELRKTVPTPFHSQGFLELLTIDYLFPGQPESIEYLETLYQELTAMVQEGKGAVPHEHFRLMSLFIPPMYLIGFFERISQEYGAVSVIEPFFTYWGEGRLDRANPLESVARKSYMLPEARMYGPMDERTLNSIVDCAQQYKVDGAIYYADVGCRHACATIKLFKDTLNDIDVPVLTLDCDVVDQSVTSEEEVREKLEQFFELLEDR